MEGFLIKFSHNKISRTTRNDSTKKIKNLMILTIILMVILVLGASFIIFKEVSKLRPQQSADSFNTEESLDSDISNSVNRLITLVNENNPLSSNFKLNLVDFMNIKCDREIVPDLNRLLTDAKNEGFELKVTKGYVDSNIQQAEYDKKVSELMESGFSKIKANSEALKTVKPANCSEYQTGLSIDINKAEPNGNEDFSQTREFKWFSSNCVNYGFILRYPEGKTEKTATYFNPYNFRYVGVENAKKMRIFDMCLDEYSLYIREK